MRCNPSHRRVPAWGLEEGSQEGSKGIEEKEKEGQEREEQKEEEAVFFEEFIDQPFAIRILQQHKFEYEQRVRYTDMAHVDGLRWKRRGI